MPLGQQIKLEGRLSDGKRGLVLLVDGGEWIVIARKADRALIGCYVNVVGERTGFNEIACDAIWPHDTPRPASRAIAWELLLVSALVAGGYAGALGWFMIHLL